MKHQSFLIFELAGKEFGIDLALVEEVVPIGMVTPLPKAPDFLAGLTAVRGRVLSVIDGAKRYGIGPALSGYFLVCSVRGSLMAVTVDRAFIAGTLPVEELGPEERENLCALAGVDGKFLRGAFELLEEREGEGFVSSGKRFLEIDANLFVSPEMAARMGAL